MRFRRLFTVFVALLVGVQCGTPHLTAWKPGQHRPHPAATPVSSQFLVDGHPVTRAAQLTAASHLRLTLTQPMRPDWLAVMLDGEPLPPSAVAWGGG